jgi:hypothetical protein
MSRISHPAPAIDFGRVRAVAEQLLILGDDDAAGRSTAATARQRRIAKAERLYAQRRRRDELFGGTLFGEPAWDLLLDLYVASMTGRRICVQSACIGAAAPPTTALRYLNLLEGRELVVSEIDGLDMRRRFVRLTERAQRLIVRLLDEY